MFVFLRILIPNFCTCFLDHCFSCIHPAQQQLGKTQSLTKRGFILPVSKGVFSITTAIEDTSINHCSYRVIGLHGAAIPLFVALIEGCSISSGSGIMYLHLGLQPWDQGWL